MNLPKDFRPDFERLPLLLLELYQEKTVEGVIQTFVRRLVEQRPHVVRLGVWLLENGELRLAASQRRNANAAKDEWKHESGDYGRVPFTEKIVGRVAASREPVFARRENDWEIYPSWARDEEIVSFYAAPIIFGDELFGVLTSFLGYRFNDSPTHEAALAWTRIFGEHLGAMIANARAFEQIENLTGQLKRENEYLREEVEETHHCGNLIGMAESFKNTLRQVELVAPTDVGVLIAGESGTGKELIARRIHELSRRHKKPLIKVNCASIPRELFESEFFGHVRGAFTGAHKDRAGRFELADGGTLFLDEVGEIPLELQAKLLRVLQENTFERVGDDKTRAVDVRIVAATNRDLRAEAAAGRFRQDLYYRLSVFPIELPPLRERQADIPVLTRHFASLFARRLGRAKPEFTNRQIESLKNYQWLGNIRELQHVIERAIILSKDNQLNFDLDATQVSEITPPSNPAAPADAEDQILSYRQLREVEKNNLRRALEKSNWKISGANGAAELLGIKPTTLTAKMKKLQTEDKPAE